MIFSNSITEPFIRDGESRALEETDLEKGTQVQQSNSDFGMDAFNKQIEEAEIQVDKLSGILINLKTLLNDANEESKSATNTLETEAIEKRMEKYIDDTVKNACNVRGKLQVITIDNILHRQMPGCQKGTASDIERMNMTNVLSKKLKELLMEFEALRQTIQDGYCEVGERLEITGTQPDEMIIDHLMETGNSKQIFPTTFEHMGRGKVISSSEEVIQGRLDAIKEFEGRFMELYQLYQKTTVLVEGQAKILDNMEHQVTDAVNHIRKIYENQKIQKSENVSRNYMIYFIYFIILIFINVFAASSSYERNK